MKAILASIQPQPCQNIASLKKQWEIRKTKPKLEVPFKVYIYCTQLSTNNPISSIAYENPKGNLYYGRKHFLSFFTSKVIGEFICDRIEEFESEFYNDDTVMNAIYRIIRDEDNPEEYEIAETASNEDDSEKFWICRESCLSFNEIKEYIGYDKPEKTFYGWHISQLKMYDKPKEINAFFKVCKQDLRRSAFDKDFCLSCPKQKGDTCTNTLTRPPQSWCYVEELPEKETYSAF